MFKAIGSGLIAFLFGFWQPQPVELESIPMITWQEAIIFDLPTQPDAKVTAMLEQYLDNLAADGFLVDRQGVWLQSDWAELAEHRGKIPLPAASLTKIATSLAALSYWGTNHKFTTKIYLTGKIRNGVVEGDLVVEGDGDPLLVWEEAIAIGNSLNQLGIRKIQGNLIISGNLIFNYKSQPRVVGRLFQQAINYRLWSAEIRRQYRQLPPDTPQPELVINGTVQVQNRLPQQRELILSHQSLTLAEIVKQMNIYSNNKMAEILAQQVGGSQKVAQITSQAARVPLSEIQLINGSGLGVENRISPRAACRMLMAIERMLANSEVKITDLFPVAGREQKGTLLSRNIPEGVAVKTGSLWQVSALAGVIPTQERGAVWFAIINYGNGIEKFRTEQDNFLQKLSQHWHFQPITEVNPDSDYFGNPSRNVFFQSS